MRHSILLLIFYFIFFAFSVFGQEAKKVDEFGNLPCDDFLYRKEGLIAELANDPDSVGYIFVYEGKILKTDYRKAKNGTYYDFPRRGEAKVYINTMKKRFAMARFPLQRLVFVNAGFRENFTVEFWLVSVGAPLPKPTPTLTKMRYRKSITGDFCGNL